MARELREAERSDRKRTIENDAARKRRRDEFLAALGTHAAEFREFHRDARKAAKRLGQAVLASFDGKAKKEKRDGERAQRERLRALLFAVRVHERRAVARQPEAPSGESLQWPACQALPDDALHRIFAFCAQDELFTLCRSFRPTRGWPQGCACR